MTEDVVATKNPPLSSLPLNFTDVNLDTAGLSLVEEPAGLPAAQAAPQPVPASAVLSRLDTMLQYAMRSNAPMDVIERLIALERDRDAYDAEKAFSEAFSAFKAEAVVLLKTESVNFTAKGQQVAYKHAELASILMVVGPVLSKYGFSWAWSVEQDRGGWIRVHCKLRHRLGHFEVVSMSGPTDDSGSKNPLQAIGSTTTYLKRYTFEAAVGMAEKSDDDDGQGGADADKTGARTQAVTNQRDPQSAADDSGMPPFQPWEGDDPAAQQQADPNAYPADLFKTNLGPWKQRITSGIRTPEQMVVLIEEKSKKKLTDQQKTALGVQKPN